MEPKEMSIEEFNSFWAIVEKEREEEEILDLITYLQRTEEGWLDEDELDDEDDDGSGLTYTERLYLFDTERGSEE